MNSISPVEDIFLKTMSGSSLALLSDNVALLNKVANDLYVKDKLNEVEVDTLKKIIMICNVLYNRTDVDILPIEDGFYDLLLEKYKMYDQHFQVGSAVVDIQNDISNAGPDAKYRPVTPAIDFFEPDEPKDEIHQQIYDDLKKVMPISRKDYIINPLSFYEDDITKRQHNTEHNHPDLIGTLDKTKFIFNQDAIDAGVFNDANVKVLERDFFGAHIKKAIIDPYQKISIVCELKYDGISVEADCTNTLESARTRGDVNVGEAADMTPILYGYPFKHARAMIGEKPIGIKFEAIITKDNLYHFNQLRGKDYKNCRTAIVGLLGASDAYKFRDLITLIPIAVDRDDVPQITNRIEEIEFLNRLFVSDGEPLRYCYFEGNVSEILYLVKAFYDEALVLRDKLNFLYDGIVISYVNENIRKVLGRSNFINKYSIAVKFNPLEKITTFRGYTYEVGQSGVITPMIHYDTVEFMGTLHNKSTGASLARFNELALKEGDLIKVTYNNDVMPYVSKLECSHNRNNKNPVIQIIDHCPICGSTLVVSDSGKSLMCPNIECSGRTLQRMVNMFQKMNIKGFSDAAISTLQLSHLYQLKDLKEEWLMDMLGDVTGSSFYMVVQSIMNDSWDDYVVMGALGFSNIAKKKWQSILSVYKISELYELCTEYSGNQLYTILSRHIPFACSRVITDEFPFFKKDIEFIIECMKISNTKDQIKKNITVDVHIRYSGCRNLQLTQLLSSQGIDIDNDGAVTRKTDLLLIPYNGFSSKKVERAEKYGIRMMVMSEFEIDPATTISEILEAKK